jgi:hypothetical protein
VSQLVSYIVVVFMDEKKEAVAKVPHTDALDVWACCGGKTRKDAIVCIGQYSIMILTMGFSAVMLIQADGDCQKSSPYIGLISFVLGKALASVVLSA